MRIAVFCGSSSRVAPPHLDLARRLGEEIAGRGHVLVYGGNRTGSMGALADAAIAAGGTVHGVVFRDFVESDEHHRGLDELEIVDDMRMRKAGLDARADGFLALPGGLGTLEELTEVLSFGKIGLHRRPIVLLDPTGFFEGLLAQIERGVKEDFDSGKVNGLFQISRDPKDAVDRLEAADPPRST